MCLFWTEFETLRRLLTGGAYWGSGLIKGNTVYQELHSKKFFYISYSPLNDFTKVLNVSECSMLKIKSFEDEQGSK